MDSPVESLIIKAFITGSQEASTRYNHPCMLKVQCLVKHSFKVIPSREATTFWPRFCPFMILCLPLRYVNHIHRGNKIVIKTNFNWLVFQDERRVIWAKAKGWPSLIFFLLRYPTIFALCYNVYLGLGDFPDSGIGFFMRPLVSAWISLFAGGKRFSLNLGCFVVTNHV